MNGSARTVALAQILLLTIAAVASAQTVKVIRLDGPEEIGAAPKTPADMTREKMARKGVIDGAQWSISLDLTPDATLGSTLDFLAKEARAKPREINLLIDRKGIDDAGISIDDPMYVKARDISIDEALRLVLGRETDYIIQDDGTVLVSSRDRLYENLPPQAYAIGEVIDALVRQPVVDEGSGRTWRPTETIRDLIERTVRGAEPWESMGGRATLDFVGRNMMIVAATPDMHERVVAVLKYLLEVDRQRIAALRVRIGDVEKRVADLQAEQDAVRAALRKLYIEAGRADPTPATVLAEAARLRNDLGQARRQVDAVTARAAAFAHEAAGVDKRFVALVDSDPELARLQGALAEAEAAAKKAPSDGDEHSKAESRAAAEKVAAAQRDVAARRNELGRMAGKDMVTSFMLETRNLAIRIAEYEPAVAAAQQSLEAYNVARQLEICDEMARLKARDADLARRMDAERDVAARLREMVEPLPPRPRPPQGDEPDGAPSGAAGGLFGP